MKQVLTHQDIVFIVDNLKNNTYIKATSLAKACHCSRETIYAFSKLLKQRGYLLISGEQNQQRKYWLSSESVENVVKDVEKFYYN